MMRGNWTLYYKPGPNDGGWTITQLKRKVEGLTWWNARVYLDIYCNYPVDSVIFAENKHGRRIYPSKFNKLLTEIGVIFSG